MTCSDAVSGPNWAGITYTDNCDASTLLVTLANTATAWVETFEDLANAATVDNGATAWSLSGNLAGVLGSAQVGTYGNEKMFRGIHLAGNVINLTTETIDVSSSRTALVYVELPRESGGMEPDDYVATYYRLDGGAWVLVDQTYDDMGVGGVEHFVAGIDVDSATTIEVQVRMFNGPAGQSGEAYFINTIAVIGDNDGAGCAADPGTITYRYLVEDACGNQVTCDQVYTIIDDVDPVITTCPANITIECSASTSPVDTNGSAVGTDNCDGAPVATYSDSTVVGACGTAFVITRTWTLTDRCGNTDTCVQTINLIDTTSPVITCPGDVNIECSDSTAPANTGSATATDNCDSSPTITFTDSIAAGSCTDNYRIARTWRATDACGNTITCQQTITLDDSTSPVITCPADVSVVCNASTDPADTGTATGTDNCDASVTITFSDVSSGSGCNTTITRTWTATDNCGNAASCDQIVISWDVTAPTINCPADVSGLSCIADVPAVNTGSVSATDDCTASGAITIAHVSDVIQNGVTESCDTNTITTGTVLSYTKLSKSTDAGLNAALGGSDQFGIDVNRIGDLNRDGIEDLAVGARYDDDGGGNRGAVYILFMDTDGSIKARQKISHTQGNGPVLGNADLFGQSVDVIGDLDGDGVQDLVVGTMYDDDGGGNRGAVYILFMNTDGTVKSSQKISSTIGGGPVLGDDDRFGISVTGLGDVNGDGTLDIAVGAHADDDGGTNRGAVYILFLNADGTVSSYQKISQTTGGGPALNNSSYFGVALAGLGDFDGDTIPDLAIGAHNRTRGTVFLTLLNANGTVKSTQEIDYNTGGGPPLPSAVQFGIGLGATDDLNGDGITDLIVGAQVADPSGKTNAGEVYILYMNANGTVASWYQITDGVNNGPTLDADDRFGRATAYLGDLDNDGWPNFAVGAIYDDDGAVNAGAVYILNVATHDVNPGDALVVTRTYKATDVCGNASICRQTFTIDDNVPPTLTCAADVTIECSESTDTANTGTSTAIDNCGSAVDVIYSDVVASGSCNAAGSITRTWTATDVCGNVSTCDQTITIVDTTAPTLTCAADVTIECDESTAPANTGTSVTSDACDPAPVLIYADVQVAGSCAANTVMTRTWTSTDECGNTVSCSQIITIVDTTAPVITCPSDVTIECDVDTQPDYTGWPVALDNCYSTNSVLTYSDNSSLGACAPSQDILRTWTATDECGNSSQCVQSIVVVDTTPPTITNCPPNMTIECDTQIPMPDRAGVQYIDNCSFNIKFVSLLNNSSVWIEDFRDQSNGTSVDTGDTAWVADDPPGPGYIRVVTQTGDKRLRGYRLGGVEAVFTTETVDVSGARLAVVQVGILQDQGTLEADDYIATYYRLDGGTWVFVDQHNDDIPAAGVEHVAMLIDVSAASTIEVQIRMRNDATESHRVDFVGIYQDNGGTACPGSPGQFTYTYSVVDDCLNEDTCTQVIDVVDSTPPTVTCPADVTLECGAATDTGTLGIATATDACATNTLAPTFVDSVAAGTCPQEEVITRTWSISDPCGNVGTCDQTITIQDTTAPSLTCAANITINCEDSIAPANTGSSTGTDNCDASPVINYTDSVAAGTCGEEGVITRTWTITDACGNSTPCNQIITIVDDTAPVITCPANLSVECNQSTDTSVTGVATATDNCSTNITIAYSDVVTADTCPGNANITRTWTATDACGNVASCDQSIVIEDTTGPTLTCPPNLTVECDESTDPTNTGTATATDECGAVPSITYSDVSAAGTCPSEEVITRTWTATDDCGNTSTCDQLITLVDTTPPILTCPTPYYVFEDISGNGVVPDLTAIVAAADNCGTVTLAQDIPPGTIFQDTILVQVTADDGCGNITSSCLVEVNETNACFAIEKMAAPVGVVDIGSTIIYSILITNYFDYAHTGVVVQDPMPDPVTYKPYSTRISMIGSFVGSILETWDTVSYKRNGGQVNWNSDWRELGEQGSPISGGVQIMQDPAVTNAPHQLRIALPNREIFRGADLSGFSTAQLSFDYRRENLDSSTDTVKVYIDPGTGGWTEINTIQGPGTDASYQSFTYDITPYLSTNTVLRLSNSVLDVAEAVFFDNIEIAVTGNNMTDIPGGAPPNLVEGLDLAPYSYFTVTYEAEVKDPPTGLEIVNTASVWSVECPKKTNSTALVTNTIDAIIGLDIDIYTCAENWVHPGQTLQINLDVVNTGTVVESNIQIYDFLSDNLTYVENSIFLLDFLTHTIEDNFNLTSYSNNMGTINWATPWMEVGESDGPDVGQVYIHYSTGRLHLENSDVAIKRAVDLSGFTNATLSMWVNTGVLDTTAEYITLDVKGPANTWTTLHQWHGPTSQGSQGTYVTYDMTPYISPFTELRFVTSTSCNDNDDRLIVDELKILAGGLTNPGSEPPDILSGFALLPGQQINMVFDVIVGLGSDAVNTGMVYSATHPEGLMMVNTNPITMINATQGVYEVSTTALESNAIQFGWTIIQSNASCNAAYDVVCVDCHLGFGSFLDAGWKGTYRVTNESIFVDVGGEYLDNDPRRHPYYVTNDMRFYRAAVEESWLPERQIRYASEEVYAMRNIYLKPGQNWVALPGIPDIPKPGNVFSHVLPAGSSPLNATTVTWYDRSNNGSSLKEIFLMDHGVSNEWMYSLGGSGSAEQSPIDMQDGIVMHLPETSDPQHFSFVGRVPIVPLVQPLKAGYNLVGKRLPRQQDLNETGLTESGFRIAPFPPGGGGNGDMAWKWDRDQQRVLPGHLLWYSDGSLPSASPAGWYYTIWQNSHWKPLANRGTWWNNSYIGIDDALIVYRPNNPSELTYTNKLLYTPPNLWMTP